MSQIHTLKITGEELDKRLDQIPQIKERLDNLLYEKIAINSFSVSKKVAEIGSTVSSVTLEWHCNKTPTTLKIDCVTDGVTDSVTISPPTQIGEKEYSNITKNTSWKITATGEHGETANEPANLYFYNGVYYGVAEAQNSYDSAFVRNLTKTLRGSKLTSFNVNADDGQYIYYCLPTSMGECDFTVNGFTGGFSLVATIEFINGSDYHEDYYIYRSDNANLGNTKVTVS